MYTVHVYITVCAMCSECMDAGQVLKLTLAYIILCRLVPYLGKGPEGKGIVCLEE